MERYYASWRASRYMHDPLFWIFAGLWCVPNAFVMVVGPVMGIIYLIQKIVCFLAGLTVLNDWSPFWALMGRALVIDIAVMSAALFVLELRHVEGKNEQE